MLKNNSYSLYTQENRIKTIIMNNNLIILYHSSLVKNYSILNIFIVFFYKNNKCLSKELMAFKKSTNYKNNFQINNIPFLKPR